MISIGFLSGILRRAKGAVQSIPEVNGSSLGEAHPADGLHITSVFSAENHASHCNSDYAVKIGHLQNNIYENRLNIGIADNRVSEIANLDLGFVHNLAPQFNSAAIFGLDQLNQYSGHLASQFQEDGPSLRLMFAAAVLFSLRLAPALIAIAIIAVITGATMYAVARSVGFILKLLISFCSV